MNKKYYILLVIFICFIGGYCIGKYNNSQRYVFHNESTIIIDTYTGTIYFPNGKTKKLGSKPVQIKEEPAQETL